MNFWQDKSVAVTGGAGFCGAHLVRQLVQVGANVRVLDDFSRGLIRNVSGMQKVQIFECNCTQLDEVIAHISGCDIVLNLAAKVTSIEYNNKHHGEMFYKNMLLQQVPLEAARLVGVERFCQTSTVCTYGHDAPIPTPEDCANINCPEDTNAGYGFAKLMGEKLARWYAEEYKMKIAITRFANLAGAYDWFDWETSHVIPSMIRKCLENDIIEVWGNGQQRREFLFAGDAAKGLMLVTEKYAEADPVNISPGFNITITELVRMIQDILGTNKPIVYTDTRPTGHAERLADNTKLMQKTGWVPSTPMAEWLERTVDWYVSNREVTK